MNNVLITGINGFIGQHLCKLLIKNKCIVSGFDIKKSNLPHSLQSQVKFFHFDLNDENKLVENIKLVKPDVIYHLAGILKSRKPEDMFNANVVCTSKLLNAITNICNPLPKVLISSSSAVYGENKSDIIYETSTVQPITDYGRSKREQEKVALKFYNEKKVPIIIARVFNVIGPRQDIDFALSSFAYQIIKAERDAKINYLRVGNLLSERDMIDVRDVVNGYVSLINKANSGSIYNLCTGGIYSIKDCLEIMMERSNSNLSIKEDDRLIQKHDINRQRGSNRKIILDTNWHPTIDIYNSINDILEYWRNN